ncbi:hypothetical protein QJQ45_012218 [Haematococcus lacustris]|nr:hypothetical protein QJQ45_002245 [Haematococcus lacustris]KAJ9514274.1 hypothetical protein QJQ45_012218 [Haematococcus lacustris]
MGLLVRYIAAPALLLPVAWPLFFVVIAYGVSVLASGVVGYAIDLLVLAAELLRQSRGEIEALSYWGCTSLRWATLRYLQWLLAAQEGVEGAVEAVGRALQPYAEELAARMPFLAAVLKPVLQLSVLTNKACEQTYDFVHDEIVPVALDLAEKLPLVGGGVGGGAS